MRTGVVSSDDAGVKERPLLNLRDRDRVAGVRSGIRCVCTDRQADRNDESRESQTHDLLCGAADLSECEHVNLLEGLASHAVRLPACWKRL